MQKLRQRARQTAERLSWSRAFDDLEKSLVKFAAAPVGTLPVLCADDRCDRLAATAMQLRADAIEMLLEWDRRWTRRLNASVGVAPVRLLFRLVSRLGNGVFWYSLMFALGVTQGRAGLETSLRMLAAGAIGLAIYKLLKSGTTRARPYQVLRDIRIGIAPLDAFSFPSGHTLHAVAFTVVAVSNFPALLRCSCRSRC